ncbi:MAG: peptidylprolyl isomerase [Flavobacteriales bacterium]
MAVIGKIREKSWLLLVAVGVSVFLFILSDFLTNYSGPTGQDNIIGEINAQPIDGFKWRYEQRVSNAIRNQQQQKLNSGQNPELSESEVEMIRGQVFMGMVFDTLLIQQMDKVGIYVCKDELNDLVQGENINPDIKRMFSSQDGQFYIDTLRKYLPIALQDTNWRTGVELPVKHQRRLDKYNGYIMKGLYVNKYEAQRDYLEKNEKVSFNFLFKRYSEIEDSTVVITEEDLRKYYNKHKGSKKLEQEESRSFKYFEIYVVPSPDDRKNLMTKMERLAAEFKKTSNDSLFVVSYAERESYNSEFRDPNMFPSEMDELVQLAQPGDVLGPYPLGDIFYVAKVQDVKMEKEARVRHILLTTSGVDEEDVKIKKRTDSILNVIKTKKNFDEMVSEFSQDYASVPNGGVYEWFPKGRMVTEFEDFSFDKPAGSVGIVKTTYGYHIVEVLGQREGKRIKAALVDNRLRPGKETMDDYYAQAIEIFDSIITTGGDLATIAEGLGLRVKEEAKLPLKSPQFRSGLPSNFNLTRWAFNAKIGDVSEPEFIGERVIVAQLTEKTEEGDPTFAQAKEIIRPEVIKEKKAQMMIAEFQVAGSITDLASKANLMVQTASDVSVSNPNIQGAGFNEHKVVARAFALKEGQLSSPIEGRDGVYVVQLVSKFAAAPLEDYSANKNEMQEVLRNRVSFGAGQALYDMNNVKDLRKRREFIQQR